MAFPEFLGAVQTVADQEREGCRDQGGAVSLGAGSWLRQGTHIMMQASYTPKRKAIFLMLLLEMNPLHAPA